MEALELYVDRSTSEDVSAWAVVAIFKPTTHGHFLCGCLADLTVIDPNVRNG